MSDRPPADNHEAPTMEIDREFEQELDDMFRRTAPPVPACDLSAPVRVAESRATFQKTPLLVRIAVPLAVAATFVTFAVIWQADNTGTGVAFAEVQERVNQTQTLTFRLRTTTGDEEPPEADDNTSRTLILKSGLVRKESSNGSYWLVDIVRGRVLSMKPADKQATLFEGRNLTADWKVRNVYDYFLNIREQAVSELPAKTIDGRKCPGFLVSYQSQEAIHGDTYHFELNLWIDPVDKLPVRIEERFRVNDEREYAAHVVIMDQFVFDEPLDPELFSFEVPAGYQMMTLGVAELNPPHADEAVQNPILTPNIGLGPARFGMSLQEVKKLLGEPDLELPVSETKVNLEYHSRGYWLQVEETLGVLIITITSPELSPVNIRKFAGKTDRGIALGASEAEVREAYGEPSRVDDQMNQAGPKTLYYDDLNGWFSFWNGKLKYMTFNMPRETMQKILSERKRPR